MTGSPLSAEEEEGRREGGVPRARLGEIEESAGRKSERTENIKHGSKGKSKGKSQSQGGCKTQNGTPSRASKEAETTGSDGGCRGSMRTST